MTVTSLIGPLILSSSFNLSWVNGDRMTVPVFSLAHKENSTDTRNVHYPLILPKDCGLWQLALTPSDAMRFWRKEYSHLPEWMRGFTELLRLFDWIYGMSKSSRKLWSREVWARLRNQQIMLPTLLPVIHFLSSSQSVPFKTEKSSHISPVFGIIFLPNLSFPLVHSLPAPNSSKTCAFFLFLQLAHFLSPHSLPLLSL